MNKKNENFFQRISDKIQDKNKIFLQEIDGKKFKYSDVQKLSSKYANIFKALGVCKGDRVAVQTSKLVDCIWIYLSLLRIGAIYLPLNPAYTDQEVKYFIEDANPKVFISDESRRERLVRIIRRAEARSRPVPRHKPTRKREGGRTHQERVMEKEERTRQGQHSYGPTPETVIGHTPTAMIGKQETSTMKMENGHKQKG